MIVLDKIIEALAMSKRTQKQLCDYLGVGKQAFSDWKSGKSESYMKYLPQIAEFLDVSVDYLLGLSDKPNYEKATYDENSITISNFTLSQKEKFIILAYRSRPEMQNAVDTLLNVPPVNDIATDMANVMAKGEKIFIEKSTNVK